jgi:peptidoglycan/xylan/chitin deacetylase (PgdA/CDA1 family)
VTFGGPYTVAYNKTSCHWEGGATGSGETATAPSAPIAACASSANLLNPSCQVCTPAMGCPKMTGAAMPGKYPGIGFDAAYDQGSNFAQPIYIPNDVIIPTLDDVTDGPTTQAGYANGNWTQTDLAFLDANDMHWDFFMNTSNWDGDLTGNAGSDEPNGYNNFVDILMRHHPANHTVHHIHMGDNLAPSGGVPQGCDGSKTTVTCAQELQGVETVVNTYSMGGTPHLTRMRPPFGEPYESNGPGNLADVEAAVAKFAVWVGWNFETHDADDDPCSCVDEPSQKCSSDAPAYNNTQSVVNQVTSQIGSGPGKGSTWGIMLSHGVLPWTAAALPLLFGPNGAVPKAGFRIGTVEDAICWKYGMHSWDVVNQVNQYTGTNARGPN